MNKSTLHTAALALFALFATPAASAQSLGGMLNQAKAKVSQATRTGASPSRATAAATQAVQGTDGELPPRPNDLTDVDAQDGYTRTVMANTRPYDDNDNATTNDEHYRKVNHRYPGFPKITWDRPALAFFASHNLLLMDYINDMCYGCETLLRPGRPQRATLDPHFKKIKEIHYGTTPTVPAKSETLNDGFGKVWNPATGVLTLTVCTKPGFQPNFNNWSSSSNNAPIEDWIIKNVK